MPQRGCRSKTGPIGKINRCASHAAAYVQQDMDSRIEAQLHRLLLENPNIANLQTVQRIGVQSPSAPDAATSLCLRLQKALKASTQGNAGLKGLQLLLCWQGGCMPGAFYRHGQRVTGGF